MGAAMLKFRRCCFESHVKPSSEFPPLRITETQHYNYYNKILAPSATQATCVHYLAVIFWSRPVSFSWKHPNQLRNETVCVYIFSTSSLALFTHKQAPIVWRDTGCSELSSHARPRAQSPALFCSMKAAAPPWVSSLWRHTVPTVPAWLTCVSRCSWQTWTSRLGHLVNRARPAGCESVSLCSRWRGCRVFVCPTPYFSLSLAIMLQILNQPVNRFSCGFSVTLTGQFCLTFL